MRRLAQALVFLVPLGVIFAAAPTAHAATLPTEEVSGYEVNDTMCALLANTGVSPEFDAACAALAGENTTQLEEEAAAEEEAGGGCGVGDLISLSPAAGLIDCITGDGDGGGGPLGLLGDLGGALDGLTEALSFLNPKNLVESWAKEISSSTIWLIDQISATALNLGTPDFTSSTWASQYAIASALGLLIFAMMLMRVAARVARVTQDQVEAVELMRDAGMSLWLVPLAIVVAPAVMVMLADLASGLGSVFAEQRAGSSADQNIIDLMTVVTDGAGDLSFAGLGGAFLALLMFLVAALLGLFVLIQVFMASQASLLLGLVLAIALGMYVWPPYRAAARTIVSGMLGLLLLSPMLQFVFWSVWGNLGSLTESGASPLEAMLRLLVGLLLLASTPALCAWLIPKLLPDSGGAGGAPAMAGGGSGAMTGMMASRLINKQSGVGGGGRRYSPTPQVGGAGTTATGMPGGAVAAKGATATGSKTAVAGKAAAGAGTTAAGVATGGAAVAGAAAIMAAKSVKDQGTKGINNATGSADRAAGGNQSRRGDK